MNAYRMEKGKLLTLVLVAACLIGVCFASFGTDVDAADGKVVEYTISESSKGDGAVISNGTESKEYTYVKPGIGFSTESTIVISDSEKLGANDTLKVTMTGGKIGELVLVYVVDKVDNTYDIEFTMSGGTITAGLYATCGDTISGYESSKSGAIGTWDDPSLSADSVTLNFNGGKVHGIQPNINLNRVQEYNVNVSGNAEIDMLKTSGSNGRVDDINVSITSGHVGYITAVRTETETISYDITGGQIDYFAIVADSEGGSYGVNQSNTAYITGNIDVSISDNVVVKQIILGSGAVDAPNKLWNSTSSTEVKPSAQSGTVTIDAPGHTIYVQQAFYDEAGKAYQLYTYIIGDTNIQTSNVDTSKFGENGVWMGVDMFDAKKTLVLRAGELFMPEGSQYSGDIVFGDGSSSLSMKNIKAGESGIRMSVGSVAISGDVFTNGDGSLTVRGEAELTGDLNLEVPLTVLPGSKLTVPTGTALSTAEGVTIINGGSIDVLGSSSATIDNTSGSINVYPGATVDESKVSGNPIENVTIPTPGEDDDFVPPFIPADNGGTDTTYLIAACAAAAVVALLAALLVMMDRKK